MATDYEALAKQFGGQKAGVDYAALAAEHGGEVAPAETTTPPAQQFHGQRFMNEEGMVYPTPREFVQGAQNIAGGAIRGSTTVPLSVSRLWQTKEAVDRQKSQIDWALQDLIGADPNSIGYGFGKLTGEISGTAGIGSGIAPLVKPLSPLAATAIESGGMTNLARQFPSAGWLTRAGATVGGGAGVGAVTGLALNPDEGVGMSTLLGAGIPVGVKTLSAVAPVMIDASRAIYNRFANPQAAAENQLLQMTGGNQQAVVNALTQSRNMQTTPGYVPNLPERLYAGGFSDPVLAAETARLRSASDEASRTAATSEARNVAALQQQQSRIQQTVAPSTQAVLPEVSQTTIGERLAEKGSKLKSEFKAGVVTPAYNKAFKLAGDAPIDVTDVIGQAESILGRKLTEFAPETAPATVKKLAQLQSRGTAATEPTYSSLGLKTSEGTAAVAPSANLEELDDIRKAVNADIASAKKSTSPTASTELSNLYKLHDAIDAAVTNSTTLSQGAKDAYTAALDTYRTGYVPRFKTGDLVDIFRTTNKNEARLLPEDTVSKIFQSENNINQFATTYKGDPQAVNDLKNGIVDIYRRKVVDATTGEIDKNAVKKFLFDNKSKIDLLEKNGVPIRAELNKADDVADWHKAFSDLKAEIPKTTDKNVQVQLTGNLNSNQLTDLQVLAEDIKRRKAVDVLAKGGKATGVEEAGLPGGSQVSKTYAIAKTIIEMVSGKTSKKVAAELARVMYDNPDAAISMLRNASERSVKTSAFRTKVGKVAEQTSKVTLPAVNALSNRKSTNSLADQEQQ